MGQIKQMAGLCCGKINIISPL